MTANGVYAIKKDNIIDNANEQLEFDFEKLINEKLIMPLETGKAYRTSIQEFQPLYSSSFLSRYEEFGLHKDLQNGYMNSNNIFFKPYVVSFEFRYDESFLTNLKDLFAKVSSNRYCDTIISEINDLRLFDIPCAIFGDFDLDYIKGEGWYMVKYFYLDTFQSIKLEYSRLIAQKLNRFSSYLYFSLIDSNMKHVVGVYSDFRDYSLEYYNTEITRKISRIAVNTNRATFSTYQVEPLSPMALSYKLRSFFLVREKPQENIYTFILFLNDDEINRISDIKIWANAEH